MHRYDPDSQDLLLHPCGSCTLLCTTVTPVLQCSFYWTVKTLAWAVVPPVHPHAPFDSWLTNPQLGQLKLYRVRLCLLHTFVSLSDSCCSMQLQVCTHYHPNSQDLTVRPCGSCTPLSCSVTHVVPCSFRYASTITRTVKTLLWAPVPPVRLHAPH